MLPFYGQKNWPILSPAPMTDLSPLCSSGCFPAENNSPPSFNRAHLTAGFLPVGKIPSFVF